MKLTSTMAMRLSLYLTAITQNVKTVKTKFKYPQYPQQVFLYLKCQMNIFDLTKLIAVVIYRLLLVIGIHVLWMSMAYSYPYYISVHGSFVDMISAYPRCIH